MNTADKEMWEEGKKAHLKLSDVAASEYKGYASHNSATRAYMRFEEDTITTVASSLTRRERALDIGCGEGRISFHLAQFFTEVIAYDMAPAMIAAADEQRLTRSHGNIRFAVRDVEVELLRDIPNESVDLVAASFGMGSFVADTAEFFQEIIRVLRPGGVSVTSFYNKASLISRLPLPSGWNASLAARANGESEHGLLVNFDGQEFDISAFAYRPDDVYHMLAADFANVRILTYPAISAVLPQDVSGHPEAVQLCDEVDRVLAVDPDVAVGAYIVSIAGKSADANGFAHAGEDLHGYARLLKALKAHHVSPRIVEHGPIHTMEDVERELDIPHRQALKSVLFGVTREYFREPKSFIVCTLSADHTVNTHKLASILAVEPDQISLASPEDCEDVTGFPAGALTPIGMPKGVPVILDASVMELGEDAMVWCGSGKRTESFVLPLRELIRTAAPSIRDICN